MENETLDYQDLSFKLNMPTGKAGTFAVWFTGLIDNYESNAPDVSEWETLWDSNDSWSRQRSCALGLNHTYRFKTGGTLHSSVAFTGAYRKLGVDDYDELLNKIQALNEWEALMEEARTATDAETSGALTETARLMKEANTKKRSLYSLGLATVTRTAEW